MAADNPTIARHGSGQQLLTLAALDDLGRSLVSPRGHAVQPVAGRDYTHIDNARDVYVTYQNQEEIREIRLWTQQIRQQLSRLPELRQTRDQIGSVNNEFEELSNALEATENDINPAEVKTVNEDWKSTLELIQTDLVDRMKPLDINAERRWINSEEGQTDLSRILQRIVAVQDSLQKHAYSLEEQVRRFMAKRREGSSVSSENIEEIDTDEESWRKVCMELIDGGFTRQTLEDQRPEIIRLLKKYVALDITMDRLQEQDDAYNEEEAMVQAQDLDADAVSVVSDGLPPQEQYDDRHEQRSEPKRSRQFYLRAQLMSKGSIILPVLAKQGDIEAVLFLLKHGAKTNAADADGWTALHHAAQQGSVALTAALIDKGAPLNVQTALGYTPIYVAAIHDRRPVLAYLLSKNVDVLIPSNTGLIPIHEAAYNGAEETIDILLEANRDTLDWPSKQKSTPLALALYGVKPVETASYLIKKGANKTAKDDLDRIPLHTAASIGMLDAVKLFVDEQSDRSTVNTPDNRGWTPLTCAIYRGRSSVVHYLLHELKAKKDVKDVLGNHLIHNAVFSGSLETLKHLTNAGLSANVINKLGLSPLHTACSVGRLQIVKFLLEPQIGARLTARDKYGFTPLTRAVSMGHLKVVEELVARNVDASARDKWQWTPLHRAAQYKHTAIADVLIKGGADIEAKTAGDWTPLHEAAYAGAAGIVELLIRNGADATQVDTLGATARSKAETAGHIEIAIYLGQIMRQNILDYDSTGLSASTILDLEPNLDSRADISRQSRTTTKKQGGLLPSILGGARRKSPSSASGSNGKSPSRRI